MQLVLGYQESTNLRNVCLSYTYHSTCRGGSGECFLEHNYPLPLSTSKCPILQEHKREKAVLVNSYSTDLDENVWLNAWKMKVLSAVRFSLSPSRVTEPLQILLLSAGGSEEALEVTADLSGRLYISYWLWSSQILGQPSESAFSQQEVSGPLAVSGLSWWTPDHQD